MSTSVSLVPKRFAGSKDFVGDLIPQKITTALPLSQVGAP